jgi:beta-lactamase class A
MSVTLFAGRVTLCAAILLAATACAPTHGSASPSASPTPGAAARGTLEQLEKSFGARLGVYAVDTSNGAVVSYRADERFAYASTHKVFTAAAVLHRTTLPGLDRVVPIAQADLVDGAPITGKHVGAGMTLRELLDAALRYSDNTADDLMFRQINGPAGLRAFLRGIGDSTTHVDRIEPELNVTAPGDPRDTTTPRAFAVDLRAVALGAVLAEDRRAVLTDMMRANTTGDALIRAGVPAAWQVADKTGKGSDYGTRNDIAVLWPPQRAPIVLAIFSDRPRHDDVSDDKLIAKATAVVVREFQR